MTPFELVIFDCDGVLVDSERIANQVFAKILKESCGLNLSQTEMFDTFVGCSSSQCMQIITNMLKYPPPVDLEDRYKQEIEAALRTSVTAVSGTKGVLKSLKIPYCVASSGSYEKMQTTLRKTGLLPYLTDKLYSTSDVKQGKPYPDIYLHAAANMSITDPTKCLVIEDSPIGVQGAVNAGMTVFGYAELMRPEALQHAGAHLIFNDMQQLLRLNQNQWPDSLL